MSQIDRYIKERSIRSPEFAKLAKQEKFNLEAAVAVRTLREQLVMTQREFAEYVGKTQPTVARIEAGSSNVRVKTLQDIAMAADKHLKIKFV
ncbi:MAG TPA: transcriptional regulator [Lactobacillus sp.]|nr:transcriptional regulator [Lactobacillus sp.]